MGRRGTPSPVGPSSDWVVHVLTARDLVLLGRVSIVIGWVLLGRVSIVIG